MRTYITSTSAISPQRTFEESDYLNDFYPTDKDYLATVEPDYKRYLDPKQSRRMAKIIKMSVVTAQKCLENAGVKQPGAIIVGTGLGCLQDTEKFLADIVENDEGILSPTAFIQSTHNTIAGQIALLLNCPMHNFTYVQRGHSFENAMQDAILKLEEGASEILLGGVDEITPTVLEILNQIGCSAPPLTDAQDGNRVNQKPVSGEGASFFLLASQPGSGALACVERFHTFYNPGSIEDVQEQLSLFLDSAAIEASELDGVLMGYNGYKKEDEVYDRVRESMFPRLPVFSFKHLCGEYFTASAFGHHLAANMLHKQKTFPGTLVSGKPDAALNKLLFYNHYKGKYHTLTLLSRCPTS